MYDDLGHDLVVMDDDLMLLGYIKTPSSYIFDTIFRSMMVFSFRISAAPKLPCRGAVEV